MRKPTCPKCDRRDQVLPIMYGYPVPEEDGGLPKDVVQGGCMIGELNPNYHCDRCEIRFDFTQPELAAAEVVRRGWIADDEPEQSG